MNKKYMLKNFAYSLMANGINFIISIMSALVVPKILGVREYSYWQLYIFYTSYAGFFHFGWADGIYLKQGGKRYREINKQKMSGQIRLFLLFESVITGFFIFISLFCIKDTERQYVLIFTGLCILVTLPRTFFQYLLQSTDRISEYAKNIIFEKIVYLFGVFILLIIGVRTYRPLLIIDIFAKTITLIMIGRLCIDILLTKAEKLRDAVKEAWDNVRVGLKLMTANIAGLLLTGIIKVAIEIQWGIETFGKASLTMTASNMVMVLISSVSIVLYPALKNITPDTMVFIYKKMRFWLANITLGMLIFYYPINKIISEWLPQYSESLKYMALLFPICVFESKTNMLFNTYLKALRYEQSLMLINWITVGVTLLLVFWTVYIKNNLTLAMLSLLLALGIRNTLLEIKVNILLQLKMWKIMTFEWILILFFCYLSWTIGGWLGTAGYTVVYVFYIIFNYKEYKK